jgi:hypothetical protein
VKARGSALTQEKYPAIVEAGFLLQIDDPELVADRLVRYARLVGRENVTAGTDCELGGRVGHPKIVWARIGAMAEGARLATRQLWNRASGG